MSAALAPVTPGVSGRPKVTTPEPALATLVELDRTKTLLSRDITAIDLRLPDRVAVRQSDAAFAAREDALKAAEKAAKKKKAGEA